jgi:4-diphosphocytidyl-2-C-methyl-D-erythritol kinase
MAASARRLVVRAYAKINRSLEVVRTRPDGYHELRTIFQSIALHDRLTLRAAKGPLRVTCDDPACPSGEDNLVWRAAAAVWRAAGRAGLPGGVTVRIQKRIPMRAGLGGGSSDAAAALRGFTALWRVRLAPDRLRRLARALGADVPFFLDGGTALGRGRGDRLTRLDDAPPAWAVIVVPPFGVSTRDAFEWWDEVQAGAPAFARDKGRTSGGGGPHAKVRNAFEAVVSAHHPRIADLVAALQAAGASQAAMSGSGSAVFGLFARRSTAAAAARHMPADCRAIVRRTLNRLDYARASRPKST